MTIVQPSYTPSPVSDNSNLPTPPSPDGTIYMLAGRNIYEKYSPAPPNPEHGYFPSLESVLQHATKKLGSAIEPEFLESSNKTPSSFTAWKFIDWTYNPVYIYVWAIEPAPAGGAA